MTTVQARKIAAVVGAFVADAAAQPLHWVYNVETLLKVTGNRPDVEFHDPPGNPFYRIETGRNSCYGDQAYVLLKDLVSHKEFNKAKYIESLHRFFGPGSEYDPSVRLKQMTDAYAEHGPKAPNSVYGEKAKVDPKPEVKETRPIDGPWLHGCLKDFEQNYKEGKEETGSESQISLDCAVRVIPLVALYAGCPELLEKVATANAVTQNSDLALAFGGVAARILEYCILNGKIDGSLEQVISDLRDPERKCPNDLDTAIAGHLQKVIDLKRDPHIRVARENFRIS